jgi:hypothetical protein
VLQKPFKIEWNGKETLDNDTRHGIMRKNLFFICKDLWVLGHRCMGKGEIHYIDIAIDNDEEEQNSQEHDSDSTSLEGDPLHA